MPDRVHEFIENQASAALIKTYKTSDDASIKQEAIYFLKSMALCFINYFGIALCEHSEIVATEVAKYGAT